MNLTKSNARQLVAVVSVLAMLGACGGTDPDKLMASARQYVAGHDLNAAIIQVKNALQSRPDWGEARLLLGQALLEKGDPVSAEVELRKALDLKVSPSSGVPPLAKSMLLQGKTRPLIEAYARTTLPEAAAQASLKTSLADAQSVEGDAEGARASIAAALQAVPDFPDALLVRARMAGDAGRPDEALAIVDKVLAADARNADAWQNKGALLAGRGDNEAAMKAFDQALAARPGMPGPRWSKVALLIAQHDLKAAQAQFDELAKAYPNDARTFYFGASLLLQKGDTAKAREAVQQLLKQGLDRPASLELAGQIELQSRSLVRAESYLARAVQLQPDVPSSRKLLARTYLSLGQPDKALATLAPALSGPSPDPEIQAMAANAHLDAGRFAQAEALFAGIVKARPDDVRARTALAVTRIRLNRSPAAFDELRAVAASDKGIFADLALVTALINAKDYPAAQVAARNIDAKLPGKPVAANLEGRIELLRGDRAAARQDFERALVADANFVPSLVSLAELDVADGKPEVAEKRFRAVFDANPKNFEAAMALAGLRDRAGATADAQALLDSAIKASPGEPAPRLTLVQHYLTARDPARALATAEAAAAALPNDLDVLVALGGVQMGANKPDQAIATYNKLVALRPQSAAALVHLAAAQAAVKDYDSASQSLRRAIDLEPGTLTTQDMLVNVEIAAKRPQAAQTVARSVQIANPNKAEGYLLEGLAQLAQKNTSGAVEAYRTALRKEPSSTVAARLYYVLLLANQKPDADKLSATWLSQHPGDVEFLASTASTDLKNNDLPGAESRLRAVLKVQPRNAEALNNLAWAAMKSGDKGATALARQAVAADPKNADYLDTLASTLASDGQTAEAISTQKSALAFAPDNDAFRLRLARLYVQSGDKTAARTELETLARQGDRFAGQFEVQRLIKAL